MNYLETVVDMVCKVGPLIIAVLKHIREGKALGVEKPKDKRP